MHYFLILFTLAAPLLSSAAPARFYRKRQATANDVLVFKFADVLEQLESKFYSQAISKFQDSDFTAAGFSSSQLPVEQFKNIQSDEATHSQTLQAALQSFGEGPITDCNFDFSSALTDVPTMAATARVVENLGVSAYLGGATLLSDPVLLDSAGSILTVEARHQTILNVLSSTGTAIPAAFDIPFTPGEVLAVAAPFISGCSIPIPANTPLTVTNTGTVAPGTLLTFKVNGTTPDDSMFCQMLVGGAPMSISLPLSQCVVPDGINGPVALFITSDNQTLVNNVRDRAQSEIVAGPTVAFIDTKPELLGQMARPNSNFSSQSTTTTTISPAQASSIVSSASTTDSAAAADATASSSSSTSSSSSGPNTATGPSADGSIIVNGWSTSSNSSSSSDPNLTNGSSADGNVASAGSASATSSAAAAVVTGSSSSSSSISAQASAGVASASGASPTSSAAAAVVASPSSSTSSPGGPNPSTGPSANGGIIVNGWSSSADANAASASSPSATGSAAAAVVASPSSSTSSSGGPNPSTGPSANGSIIVNGWSSSADGNAASASSPSATGSAAAIVVNSSSLLAPSSFGGPNKITGPSADGSIVVNGWSNSSS